MKIINNAKNNQTRIDNLKIGELFLFNEKLYMKMAPDAQYYLAFMKFKSCDISTALDDICHWITKQWGSQEDLSPVPYDYGCNVFNLTDNCLEYLDDAAVTLVKGALTIENV